MKSKLKIVKYFFFITAGLFLLAFAALMGSRLYLEFSTGIDTADGISELEEVS